MSLLDHNMGDLWLVVFFQILACLSHGEYLPDQNRQELTLAHSISEHNNFLGLPPLICSVELHEKVLGHVLHVLDDLLILPSILDPDLHLVVCSLGLHRCNNGSDTGFETPGLGGRVRNIRTHHRTL